MVTFLRAVGSMVAMGGIETSGLIGFQIVGAPDASASQGERGTWLIGPYNITVTNSSDNDLISPDGNDNTVFVSNGVGDAQIDVSTIQDALLTTNVIIRTEGDSGPGNGDITFDRNGNFNYDSTHLQIRSRHAGTCTDTRHQKNKQLPAIHRTHTPCN